MIRNGSSINSSPQHGRRDLAQFWTPPSVADFMAAWVLERKPEFVVDPAFGMGALADAIRRAAPSTPVLGFEVDHELIHRYRQAGGTAVVHEADYMSVWSRSSYPAIICNPPYLQAHRFRERSEAIRLFQEKTGIKLPGKLNAASIFLLKALRELTPQGRSAFMMPHEFMGTSYGIATKRELLRNGLHSVIVIQDEHQVFADALTSVCILLCDRAYNGEVSFRLVRSPEDLHRDQHVRKVQVSPNAEDNWMCYLDDHSEHSDRLVPLGTYGAFSRGIATGANGFFTMTPSEAKARGLLASHVRPCLTRACQVKEAVVTEKLVEQLLCSDERVYLLSVSPEEKCEQLRQYLQQGEDAQVHLGALASRRHPWYHIAVGAPACLLATTFGRGRFKIVMNEVGIPTLNAWHGFYPQARHRKKVNALFLWLRSSYGQEAVLRQRRRYGRRLDKLEPGDMNRVLVPPPHLLESLPSHQVEAELDRLRNGKELTSRFLSRLSKLR